MNLVSWVCPAVVDEKGKIKSGGCGGYWGDKLPGVCLNCGGKVTQTDTITVIQLEKS